MSKNVASIVAVFGATGSGKSLFVKEQLAIGKPSRLMIWDPMKEYGSYGQVFSKAADAVKAVAKAGKNKKFSIVFQPSFDPERRAKQFDFICGFAYALGDLTFLVEELRFVTTPSYAPMNWAQITLTGRHKGLMVIGVSQRPASIDKDFLSGATLIHTGKLTYPEDRKAVAKAMGEKESLLEGILPLEYVEKNMDTGEMVKGKMSIPSKK